MRDGALVMTPDFEVGEVVADCGQNRAIVRPLSGARCEAFDLVELVELRAARKLRSFPTAEVETRWGVLRVQATAESTTAYGRQLRDKVSINTFQERPITVNGVTYMVSSFLARDEAGIWEEIDYRFLRRAEGYGEPTAAARRAIWNHLAEELGPWLRSHPHFLEEAHRAVLSNTIAKEEGRILAAKLAYQDAVKRRAKLLAQEETA